MEPNKIEKHMQEVLKERKISPSGAAWESISKELDANKKPDRKMFYLYGIAASILLLVSFSLFVYTNKNPSPINEVVIEETDLEEVNEGISEQEIISENESEIAKGVTEEISKESPERRLVSSSINKEKEAVFVLIEPLSDNKNSYVITDSVLDIKVAAIVKKTEFLKTLDYEVTDSEIDSLIREAQSEIVTNKIFVNNKKVDALALLNEVEGELDASFRDQIFKSLKSKFLKVRTAVADRNN